MVTPPFCSVKPYIYKHFVGIQWVDYGDLFNVKEHFLHNDKA